MNAIGYFLIAVMIFVLIQMEIDSQNPCSSFSKNPSECNSDMIRQ